MIGVAVWSVLTGCVVYAWAQNWSSHVPADAGVGRRVLVAALYLVGVLFCVAGVVGSCARVN